MAKPLPTVWKIEKHTLAKHEILKKYLDAWAPIMSRCAGRIVYIDGFAGPGKYSGGEDGSPIIAIKSISDNQNIERAEIICLFIEADTKRYQHLKELVDKIRKPSFLKVKYHCGKFDETLTDILNDIYEQKKSLVPTFAFIDPFGVSHTPFHLIRRLLENPKCEALITFMYDELSRFFIDESKKEIADNLFGTPGWCEAINIRSSSEKEEFLQNLYKQQLQTAATYVVSFKMVNRQNRTDYFLFFATNNLTGLEKMKDAMWKADPTGTFTFLALTDMNTPYLIPPEPDSEDLKKRIVERFKGSAVRVEELKEFVLSKTPYRASHYKREILAPMEGSDELQVVEAKPGRRRGNFPEGTLIKFN